MKSSFFAVVLHERHISGWWKEANGTHITSEWMRAKKIKSRLAWKRYFLVVRSDLLLHIKPYTRKCDKLWDNKVNFFKSCKVHKRGIKFNYLSAFLTFDHRPVDTGGIKRSDPIGGEAYGMPLKTSTGPRFRLKFSNCTIVPVTWPYFVCTIREVICAWSLGVEESLSSPPDEESGSSVIINATSNIFTSWINFLRFFSFYSFEFWNKSHTHFLHMFQFTWNISTLQCLSIDWILIFFAIHSWWLPMISRGGIFILFYTFFSMEGWMLRGARDYVDIDG